MQTDWLLRERDKVLLARYFAARYHKPDLTLADSALAHLRQYPFPGNVDELQNALERAIILAEGPVLHAADLMFSLLEAAFTPPLRLNKVEKATTQRVIDKYPGNIS